MNFLLTLVYVHVRPISALLAAVRLLTKPFFARHSTNLLAKLYMCEVVANGPRLCLGCLPNLLLRMRRNRYDCTYASYIDCKIKFSVAGYVQNLNICQFRRVLDHFGHFKCACAETAIRLLLV